MSETPFVRHNPRNPCFGVIKNVPHIVSPYSKLAAMPEFTSELADRIFRERLTKRAYKFHANDKSETMWDVMQWAKEQAGLCV